MSQATAWRIIVILAVIETGAFVGNEAAKYFWDLTSYVVALDTDNPYRSTESYPFLYPPFAVDLFTLARSHLFELLSIGYVAALALFLNVYARLDVPRRWEWLAAITAMGGMGVVSLETGNVAILMNFTLLAVALQAAMGQPLFNHALPIVIAVGALLKPQFALYVALLPLIEKSRKVGLVKTIAVIATVIAVYVGYMLLRPAEWSEYVQAVVKRTVVEKDFGWGPAALSMRFSTASSAPYAAYVVGFLIVAALGYLTLQRSRRSGQPVPAIAMVSLAFFVLTFANPRLPLYDLYAAGVALIICCGLAARTSVLPWVMVSALAINLVPWSIANFTRAPAAWPWWMQDALIMHLLGVASLLVALSRAGILETAES